MMAIGSRSRERARLIGQLSRSYCCGPRRIAGMSCAHWTLVLVISMLRPKCKNDQIHISGTAIGRNRLTALRPALFGLFTALHTRAGPVSRIKNRLAASARKARASPAVRARRRSRRQMLLASSGSLLRAAEVSRVDTDSRSRHGHVRLVAKRERHSCDNRFFQRLETSFDESG